MDTTDDSIQHHSKSVSNMHDPLINKSADISSYMVSVSGEQKITFTAFDGGNTTWDNTAPTIVDYSNVKRDGLGKREVAAYAVGHFNNDLCAAAWFTYVLYYIQDVVGLDPVIAGFAMLSGQIADGITTPIVGFGSDKCKTKIGARAPWYLAGSILVIPSFLGIFIYPGFEGGAQIAYYIILPAIFNVGWACVQISNMAVVNSITFSTQRRDRLISLRNGFTFVANFTVLTSALIIFVILSDPIWQFRVLCFLIVGLGAFSSSFYFITIKEPFLSAEAKRLQKEFKKISRTEYKKEEDNRISARQSMLSSNIKQWYHWFGEGQFYIYGMVYMMVRIAVNVTMSVQPFYLIIVTGFIKTEENPTPIAIALVPLVSYISSMIFSLFFYKKMMNALKNRFIPLFVSIIIISCGSIPYIFLNSESNIRWLVYLLSSIQGVGLAIMLNTATSLISDVIGKDDQSSAFVYGAYSFFDKVANGILIFFITAYFNKKEQPLRYIIGLIPVICSIAAFGLTYLGKVLYSERLAQLSINKK
ncbi:UNKNOWN [Stylonychia lemnae]|uniref:Major facilitator superfamily protein n=1 Tax=Stylonychia lemnae TaxID=5949 RepID=A0A078AF49_STYLE|nr:UNKNOWN [Stylonychia lemnae]|eukprot:CDW80446.1 UNKNOWN [Stylonychia lemnae]